MSPKSTPITETTAAPPPAARHQTITPAVGPNPDGPMDQIVAAHARAADAAAASDVPVVSDVDVDVHDATPTEG